MRAGRVADLNLVGLGSHGWLLGGCLQNERLDRIYL